MSRGPRALAAALAVGLALLTACGSDDAPADPPAQPVAALAPCPEQPDTPAADSDLPAVSLDCLGGGTLDLTRAPGVPTVLNLWASWCGPCREELPLVQELADVAGDQVRVVGVASKDGMPQATSFAADAGITFPGAFDGDGAVMTAMRLVGLPATAFLAADGSVAFVQVGPVRSIEEFEELVATHLGVQL
ncbi:TlpA family protein disulfide reductase [Modestobacter sp. SSW1-42]|uniref:TlpA family protein disulfide reductase n=1 Tax=Modestobacter sp. SSW1-42 TaxID=596372 RepID=UPI003985D4BF